MFRNFAWSPSLTSVAITWVIISQSPRMRPLLTKFEFETKFEVKGITDLSSDYMMSTFLMKFALDLYIYTCTIQILYCHRAANGTRILTNFISINYIANQQWCAKFIFLLISFPVAFISKQIKNTYICFRHVSYFAYQQSKTCYLKGHRQQEVSIRVGTCSASQYVKDSVRHCILMSWGCLSVVLACG